MFYHFLFFVLLHWVTTIWGGRRAILKTILKNDYVDGWALRASQVVLPGRARRSGFPPHSFLLLLRARQTGLADLHVTAPHRSSTGRDQLFSVPICMGSHADSSFVSSVGEKWHLDTRTRPDWPHFQKNRNSSCPTTPGVKVRGT